jgi:hypothetical protein
VKNDALIFTKARSFSSQALLVAAIITPSKEEAVLHKWRIQ